MAAQIVVPVWRLVAQAQREARPARRPAARPGRPAPSWSAPACTRPAPATAAAARLEQDGAQYDTSRPRMVAITGSVS